MTEQSDLDSTDGIIATIENKDDPSQSIGLKYLSNENAFVTSGIQTHFGEKEILIPSHLVVINFDLMATIVSSMPAAIMIADVQNHAVVIGIGIKFQCLK